MTKGEQAQGCGSQNHISEHPSQNGITAMLDFGFAH